MINISSDVFLIFRVVSLFRMTMGSDDKKNPGDRTPAVFFQRRNLDDEVAPVDTMVCFSNSLNVSAQDFLTVNKWHTFKISQEMEGLKFTDKVIKRFVATKIS